MTEDGTRGLEDDAKTKDRTRDLIDLVRADHLATVFIGIHGKEPLQIDDGSRMVG
jgi:hypothetical protein